MPDQPETTPEPLDHVLSVGSAGQLAFITTGENEGSGWARFFPHAPGPTTYLRFVPKAWTNVPQQSFRLMPDYDDLRRNTQPFYDVVELYFVDGEGLTGRDLRALPLGQIEAAVNQMSNAARMTRYANRTEGHLGITFDVDLAQLEERTPKRRRPRMAVKVPEGAKKPDSFYEAVAYRYGWLQGEGVRKPAEALAEANDVPTTTVHRWIKEARRRGLMAPGQRNSRKDSQ